jgi:hypothetical protein
MTEAPPVTEAAEPGPAAERRGARLVLDLLVFPLVMVAVGVGIFVLFGLITSEGKGPADYFDLIRTGDANRRWQAATAVKVIGGRQGGARPTEARHRHGSLEEAKADDPRVQGLPSPSASACRAVRPSSKTAGVRRGGTDPETHIYAIWPPGRSGMQGPNSSPRRTRPRPP